MKAEITLKKVVYEIPGMDQLIMLPAVEYRRGEPRPPTMDLYYPTGTTPGATGEELKPAVLIVLGYPDVDVSTPFGCQFREMGMITSWARLFAGSGMVGIVYENQESGRRCRGTTVVFKNEWPRSRYRPEARCSMGEFWECSCSAIRVDEAERTLWRALLWVHAGPRGSDLHRGSGKKISLRQPNCRKRNRRSSKRCCSSHRSSGARSLCRIE